MERTVRQLSLTFLLVSAIFAQAASAQLQGGTTGEGKNSIGALDGSVHADVEQSRPGSSGGRAAPATASGSRWIAKPDSVSVGARSEGAGEIASWSPVRSGAQASKFRPGGQSISSLGGKPAEIVKRAETPKKDKGNQPLLQTGGSGVAELQPGPFAHKEFTGKVRYAYSSSGKSREQARQKIAKQLKASGAPTVVGKRKKSVSSAKAKREFQAQQGQQGCDASKLKLCTWLSTR